MSPCNNAAGSTGRERALVIGGSRFIGLPLVERLLAANYDVTVLNRGSRRDRLPQAVETLVCDRTDHRALATSLEGRPFELVFDMVAYTPDDTSSLLASLDQSALRHFVHISTGSVYLPSESFPLKEHFPRGLRGPGHEYGDRKYLIEEILFTASSQQGLPVTIIRPGVVFGPFNYVYREAFYFDRLLAGRPLLVPGDGSVLTQFGYVDDLAEMTMAIPGNDRAIGESYNFAGEYSVTTDYYMQEVIRVVGERFGSEAPPGSRTWPQPEIIYYDPRALDIDAATLRRVYPYRWSEHVVRDTSKAQAELGYREAVSLEEGLRRSFAWYLAAGRAECGFAPDYAAEDAILRRLGR